MSTGPQVAPTTSTDVLVVGAGPVGLALAGFLGRRAVSCTVVESRPARTARDESRAITWMPEGLLAADELGVTQELRDRGVMRRYHDFVSRPGGRTLVRLDMARLGHRHGYSVNLPQGDTEEVLERAAVATGRVHILRGVRPAAVSDESGGVVAVLARDDGRTIRVSASFGAACDGASSVRTGIARLLGVDSTWRDYGSDSVVADVELATDPGPTDRSWIALDPARPLGAFCFGPRRWRLVYRVNRGESRELATSDTFVADQLARAYPGVVAERLLWASAFRLGQGQAEAYTRGRWALAGDAAHAMGPSAGAGMQVGVLGAWRLADHLAASVREPQAWRTRARDYEAAQRSVSSRVQRSNARTFAAMAVTSRPLGVVRAAVLGGAGRLPIVTQRLTADATLAGLAPAAARQQETSGDQLVRR